MRQKRRQDGGHLACRLRYFPGNVALVARNGKFRRTRLAACNRSKAWPVWLGQTEVGWKLASVERNLGRRSMASNTYHLGVVPFSWTVIRGGGHGEVQQGAASVCG